MTVRIPEQWTRFLLRQPESGMGYQRVDVRLANNRQINDVIVLLDEQIDDRLLDASVFFSPGSRNPFVEGGEAFIVRDPLTSVRNALCGQT